MATAEVFSLIKEISEDFEDRKCEKNIDRLIDK